MFKFLFGRKGGAEPVKETQRETLERAIGEINEIMAGLTDKPKLTVDMDTGGLTLDLPEQMPDEALALPAPAADTAADDTADTAEADTDKPAA
ncbi:hypothetical protein [Salibaculum halophilum]|uniref:hypothetical protein n=1 Tax=Salibaculum halophilum TaxID=1914408 RepID=UPI000A106ADA|nr:hypothetical protein [Salibaculum halophilum]